MRARRRAAALALVVVAAAALDRPAMSGADPFVPADDGEVLERLPASRLDPAARRSQALRAELARQPGNLALATRVAWSYIDQGRTLSDPRYYGYAQGALAPWWLADDPPVPVLVLRATIRQHDHDFPSALQDLAQALRSDPANAQAWLTQATVQQVRGEYAEARRSCLEVLQLANPLVAVTCINSVDSLSGAAQQSYDRLRRALVQARDADSSARLWALTTLAEIAVRTGQPDRAEKHFRQALSLGRADDYRLASYADFLLDVGRPAAARELLKDATRVDALLLRLALAEQALASPELGPHVEALRERFAAARARGDTVHRREEARFAVLRFAVECARAPRVLDVRYGLFFDFDPQHRGLLRVAGAGGAGMLVFSAPQPVQRVDLGAAAAPQTVRDFWRDGVRHSWAGFDHVLFLLALLMPAVLRRTSGHWQAAGFRAAAAGTLKVVTAFVVASSITLSLAALDLVHLPVRWVESGIAASVAVAALNNAYPLLAEGRWLVGFGFGLLHGFGFARVFADAGLPLGSMMPLLGFNVGVESWQLLLVGAFLPLAYLVRRSWLYQRVTLVVGSSAIAVVATIWFLQRALSLSM